jgi:ribose transport system substrate-binding protein
MKEAPMITVRRGYAGGDRGSWRPSGAALLVAGSVVLAASGCATQDSGQGDTITGGMTAANAGNAFYSAEAKGAKAEADKQGVQLDVQFANNDLATQSDQIDTFVRKGVDFIVVDAVDSEGIAPAIARALAAKIPVVAIDVTATGAEATVMTDNKMAGKITCEYLIQRIGGKGTFAIADSIPVSAISDRVAGCEEALEAAPGVQMVAKQRSENSRDGGLSLGTELLTAHPDVNAIFASNDPQAAGVALAAQQKGNDEVIVGGVDGSVQVTNDFSKGGNLIATAGQFPTEMGAPGVQLALELRNGKKPAQDPELIAPVLLTKETITEYQAWD